MAEVIMVQGTMSNAGKSFLAAALCRIFHEDGYRALPFKSQNMALNSFVTKEGLEMGRAQVMQAEAAGEEPVCAMNPILLKPTSDAGSQVIVNGKPIGNMDAVTYFRYKKKLIPEIIRAFQKLEERADIIVVEGAGSPAEINLRENDIVNMGLAGILGAPVLLVGDIDRGGVFAQLVGTMELLEPEEKERVKGFVINKFRGDERLLAPGIDILTQRTGVPTLGVLPYAGIRLDDEDSLSERLESAAKRKIDIAVVRLPHISNFTDFDAFDAVPDTGIRYVSFPEELPGADLVILPGSKNTIGDLGWLAESGMAAAVRAFAAHGPVLGICGGYQMLGESVSDPWHSEEGGERKGLGLLPVRTVLGREKTTRQSEGTILTGPLAGEKVQGYEIHMGSTRMTGKGARPFLTLDGSPEGAVCGNVRGTYLHGLFDAGDLAGKTASLLAERKGLRLSGSGKNGRAFREEQYRLLADTVRSHLDMKAVYAMLKEAAV